VRLIYTLLLVAVTAVWGWTFVVVQDAISFYDVIPFLAVRFVLAGTALAPIYARKLTRRSLIVGGGIGVVLAAGYLFQTTGLLFTTPTNSSSSRRLPTASCSGPTSRGRSYWPSP
jgi:drug/metabolite transporter (DMT)-like permease